ncbi:MAG: hypothetical protein JW734_03285 [Candidatus Omnitrophica bacterium]|nr:hypothetical protein [Candidatus Omnitrophota bacterium]
MIKKVLIPLVIFMFFVSGFGYSDTRNPFVDLLPKREDGPVDLTGRQAHSKTKEVILPSSIIVEGVFWDTQMPQAIINGDVYKERETLKDASVEIVKIEKGLVHLLYQGRIFIVSPSKKSK